ncbi:MAG: hypothetical protein SNH35_05840 [Rikenellaceae bacterium]
MRNILLNITLLTLLMLQAAEVVAQSSEIEQRRQNRGLVAMDNLFVPKGQWIVGIAGSYSTHSNDNYSLLVVEDIRSNGYNISASPMVSYAVKNNLTVGARMEYGRTLMKVDNATLSIGDDDSSIDLSIVDIYSISQSFQGKATLRQYIPVGHTKRFSMFSEVQFGLGGSRSKYAFDSPVQGTYAKSVDVSLNVMPGIIAFATNNIAFEVTVGALGVSFSHEDQIQNQVYTGSMNSSSMSFTVNLFSIGLGAVFFL